MPIPQEFPRELKLACITKTQTNLSSGDLMNIKALLGGVSFGRDTSGNFRLSLMGGIAVRTAQDGRYVLINDAGITDVTDMTLEGSDNLVFRVPADSVAPGDLIITSENPFSVLFVQEVLKNGHIRGVNPATSAVVEYVPPMNILKKRIYVKAVSLFGEMSGKKEVTDLLPLLLAKDDSGKPQDMLSTVLLMKSMDSGGVGMERLLPMMLSHDGKDSMADALLLLEIMGKPATPRVIDVGPGSSAPKERLLGVAKTKKGVKAKRKKVP
jgi:hypothetical protein